MSSITREQVLEMPLDDIFAAIKNPQTSAEMQFLLRDRKVASRVSALMLERQNQTQAQEDAVDAQLARVNPPSTEQLAAEAQQMAAAEPSATVPVAEPVQSVAEPVQSVPAVVDYSGEDAAWKAEGVMVYRDPQGKIVRMVQEYQVSDEDGTPIGRPTHLEAKNPQELLSKQRVAHENATRAFHRLKKQKLTFKQEQKLTLTPEQIKAAAEVALQEKDPAKVQDVIRATVETEFSEREKKLREKELQEEGRAISNEFMRRHLHDYVPCDANRQLIGDYFTENRLEFTLDNLEAAFVDLTEQGKLVKVEKSVQAQPSTPKPAEVAPIAPPAATAVPAAATPTNSEAASTTVTSSVPTAQPVAQPEASQPVVEATATTPVAAPIAQPAARRPGVNGSLPPRTMSAHRPGPVDPALARKEFMQNLRNMKPEIMKAKLKSDPQFVKQLETYGIKVR